MTVQVNHVGITVPDIVTAIAWYSDVFGLTCDTPPVRLEGDRELPGMDAEFKAGWLAALGAENGVGLELFQFDDPPVEPAKSGWPVPYTRRGPWHVCLTVADVDGTIARIVEHGGQLVTRPLSAIPGKPHVFVAYTTDPWGTTIELISHSYVEAFTSTGENQ